MLNEVKFSVSKFKSTKKNGLQCAWHDLSKYTVPTSFVGIGDPTKLVGMLVLSALPSKVLGI